jgi:hypothetical protein
MSPITPSELAEQSSFLPWPNNDAAVQLAGQIIHFATTLSCEDEEEFLIDVAEAVMPVWNDEIWALVVELRLYESGYANEIGLESKSPTNWAKASLFQTIYELVEIFARFLVV